MIGETKSDLKISRSEAVLSPVKMRGACGIKKRTQTSAKRISLILRNKKYDIKSSTSKHPHKDRSNHGWFDASENVASLFLSHACVRRTCFAHFYPVCKEKGGAHERSYMMGLVHVSLHFVCSDHIDRVIRRSFRSSGRQNGSLFSPNMGWNALACLPATFLTKVVTLYCKPLIDSPPSLSPHIL